MEERHKIFQKGYNKILDLVEEIDGYLVKKYKQFVNSLPEEVIDVIGECEDACGVNDDYDIEICALVNAVDIDFTRFKNYLRTNICVHRIFEDNLFEGECSIRIFSFSERNTKKKMPDLKMFYEEVDGKYRYLGNNDQTNGNAKEYEWDVYLDRFGDDFILSSTMYFKGCEIYKNERLISFDEVMQCVEDEDDFEEDMEFDFTPDFDI